MTNCCKRPILIATEESWFGYMKYCTLSRKSYPTLDRSLLLYSPFSVISPLHHYWSYVYKQDHLLRMLAYTSSTQVRFILRNKEEQKGLVSACDSKNFFGRMILKNLDWNNLCRFDSHGGENVNKVNADIFCPKYYFLAWHFLFGFSLLLLL